MMARSCVAREIALWLAALPRAEASMDEIHAAFPQHDSRRIRVAINNAQRAGWIAQRTRKRPARYARTTTPVDRQYRPPPKPSEAEVEFRRRMNAAGGTDA
jgi:hypothetical protein